MLRFILFAVVAYFLFQFVMAVDWNWAGNKAVNNVEQTAGQAADKVENSSVGRAVGDSFETIKNLILP